MSGELLIRDSGAALSFLGSLAAWLPSAPVEDLPRVLDEVGRVKRIADELGDRELTVEASIGEQRVKREIGKRHPRQAAGRPAAGEENRFTDETISRPTIHRYRADAESATDAEFEEAAEEARKTGEPLTRSKVRAAGGGQEDKGPEVWVVLDKLLKLVREALERIDLDPASSDASQEWVQAGRHLTVADSALDEETKWAEPDAGLTCWLNPPRGKEAGYASRICRELDFGSVSVCCWLSRAATSEAWAQQVMGRAQWLCFLRGRFRFPSIGEERDPTLEGHMLLLLLAEGVEMPDVGALAGLGVVCLGEDVCGWA